MTYAFTYAEISPSPTSSTYPPPLRAQIPASRLKSQPWCSNPSLEAQIQALKLKSQHSGSNLQTRKDELTNKSPPVFYRTSSPSGPLPCSLSLTETIIQSRATGIADHILPLGDWFTFLPDHWSINCWHLELKILGFHPFSCHSKKFSIIVWTSQPGFLRTPQ